jgi:hypothetical protein
MTYHIFTNSRDEWTENKTDALLLFMQWYRENGSVRLYEEDRDIEGNLYNESCILSVGSYPM